MTQNSNHPALIVHQPGNRCFAGKDGGVLDYDLDKQGQLVITHVAVPEHLRGRGIAAQLVEAALAHAGKHALTVISECEYATAYLKKRSNTGD